MSVQKDRCKIVLGLSTVPYTATAVQSTVGDGYGYTRTRPVLTDVEREVQGRGPLPSVILPFLVRPVPAPAVAVAAASAVEEYPIRYKLYRLCLRRSQGGGPADGSNGPGSHAPVFFELDRATIVPVSSANRELRLRCTVNGEWQDSAITNGHSTQ
jgi:hypothetical protein